MHTRPTKTLLSTLTLGLAIAIPVAAAPGPALPIIGSPTGLSAGVFLPSSAAAKTGGSTQLDVEFRYAIPLPNPTPIIPVLGIGVETGDKSGSRSTVIPATAGILVGLNGKSPNSSGSVFAGGGVGEYFLNQHANSSSSFGQLGTTTRTGAFGELGYNVTHLLYLDARYQWVTNANGVSATAGLRF